MAKKIKFALKMKDGAEVRDIESLREHFDADTVVGYFLDGRLLTWLGNFYYDTEADLVEELDKNDGQLKKKLCEIFNVEYEDDGEFDVELAAKRREKLEKLKQYTADEKILALVDNVAFDRSDMVELMDEDADTIVLVDGTYRIPLREHNKKYIGVGNVVAEINSKEVVDFDKLGITFENIHFNDEYLVLLNGSAQSGKDLFNDLALEVKQEPSHNNIGDEINQDDDENSVYDVVDSEAQLQYFLELAEHGDASAMGRLGEFYDKKYFEHDKAVFWWTKGAELNDCYSIYKLGLLYITDNEYGDDFEARKLFTKGNQLGDVRCSYKLANFYKDGRGGVCDIDRAIELYTDIAYKEEAKKYNCMTIVGDIYRLTKGYVDYKKALNAYLEALKINDRDGEAMNGIGLILADETKAVEWFKKSADAGCCDGMYNLGCAYYYGTGIKQNYSIAREWFERSVISKAYAKLGDMYRLGKGVKIDGWRSHQYYERAILSSSSDANGEAYNGLGLLVENKLIKGKAPKHILEYYKASAEAGYPLGMYNVARCYINGLGNYVDRNLGWEWMRKAADAGIDEAKNFLRSSF